VLARRATQAAITASAAALLAACTADASVTETETTDPVPIAASQPTAVPSDKFGASAAASASASASPESQEEPHMNLTFNGTTVPVTLADNSSVEALIAHLADGPLTLTLADYGSMEKVGPLGFDLPRNDEQITTQAGDVILYQGGALVIYYAPNSWNFTRLGRIEGYTGEQLKAMLGSGNVDVTLELGD